jgi:DNA replication initiation complex subunit (GINS family)
MKSIEEPVYEDTKILKMELELLKKKIEYYKNKIADTSIEEYAKRKEFEHVLNSLEQEFTAKFDLLSEKSKYNYKDTEKKLIIEESSSVSSLNEDSNMYNNFPK